MLSGPTAFYTVAEALVTAVNTRLAATTAGSPERACVVPGQIAWDGCDCGLLAATVERIYQSDAPPGAAEIVPPCPPGMLGADILLQVVRCAPNPDDRGNPPSCAALDTAAQTVLTDAYELGRGVSCALADMADDDDIDSYLVRPATFLGPQGGCVGAEIRASVLIDRN